MAEPIADDARLRRLGLPGCRCATRPTHRHGPRRRRGDVRRAHRAPVPAGVRRRGRRRARRLRRARPSAAPGWRSPPTRSWCGRCSSPAAASATWPSTAPSTTWRCAGATPLVPLDGVHPRGGHRRWPRSAGSPRRLGAAARSGRRPAGHRRHQGRRRRARRRRLRQHRRASACVPDGVDIRPDRACAGDVVIVSGDIGVHGVAVMSCREGLEFGTDDRERHRAAARPGRGDAGAPAPTCTCCATRPAAAWRPRSTRSRGPPGSGIDAGRARPADPRRRRATPAGCSGSTRCTSPTRASCSRSCPPERRRRGARGDAGPPAGRRGAVVIGSCVAEHPGMVVARTGLGGTRVVDLPIGEQLPRIC